MVKVDDFEVPENLFFHKEYLWAKVENGKVKIGMIDFAQKQLHDIVYVELPGVGDSQLVREALVIKSCLRPYCSSKWYN